MGDLLHYNKLLESQISDRRSFLRYIGSNAILTTRNKLDRGVNCCGFIVRLDIGGSRDICSTNEFFEGQRGKSYLDYVVLENSYPLLVGVIISTLAKSYTYM